MTLPWGRASRLGLLYAATSLHLLVPMGRHPSSWLAALHWLLLGGMLAVLFAGLRRPLGDRPADALLWLCRIYALWIGLSALIHGRALSRLPSDSPITVGGMSVADATTALPIFTFFHLLLPATVGFALTLFSARDLRPGDLSRLPLVALPSVAVALYQARSEIGWLNVPYFAERGQAAGLGHDANSLAAGLILLLPWCLVGWLCARSRGERLVAAGAATALLSGVVAAGSRSGVAGAALLVAVLFAVILVSEGRADPTKAKRLAAVAALGLVSLTVVACTIRGRRFE
jgi:hypothetical protein